MLYALLKTLSWIASHTPYKLLVKIGTGLGHLYWHIAKKQRIRAEETIRERLGYTEYEAKTTIKRLFINLGISVMEMLYMPALNKDNIRGLVTFDHPEILWEALQQKKGVVMLACHIDNWEWLGAALALNGFPLSAVEKPQPNRVYSDFMNELRRGVGQEIFARGSSEILGCARAMKKGRMLGLIADQDGGYEGIFVVKRFFYDYLMSVPVRFTYDVNRNAGRLKLTGKVSRTGRCSSHLSQKRNENTLITAVLIGNQAQHTALFHGPGTA